MRRDQRKKTKRAAIPRIRMTEALLVLSVLASLVVLGPLRNAVAEAPPISFLATLVLFMLPGAFLARLLARDGAPLLARVPVAFALSAGVFGVLGVPMLALHRSLDLYLWLCGGVAAISLVLMVLGVFRRMVPEGDEGEGATGSSFDLLWIPFALFGVVLAFVSVRVAPSSSSDIWLYLTHVQDYLGRDRLGLYPPYAWGSEITGFTRMTINGWLLEQAAFARVSGIGNVELVLRYLTPTLILVSLLAFYWLAFVLLNKNIWALWAGCLFALFLLVNLSSSVSSPGGEFLGRITEDKFVARFVFLPVTLGLAVLFLERRRLRHLALFAVVCVSLPAIHPLGFVIAGISIAALGLLHVASNLRLRESWFGAGALGAVPLGVVALPAIYLLLTGGSFSLGDSDPARDAKLLYSAQEQQRLLLLGEDSYMMHPALLLEPVILAAYVVGVPFLLWRVRRSVPAQALLGILLVVPTLVYVPPIATFLAGLIEPWHLWRLAWPLPLAAYLTLGWIGAESIAYAQARLGDSRPVRLLAPLLPVILVAVLALFAAPAATTGARSASGAGEIPLNRTSCMDPIFPWMRNTIKTTTMVVAPDAENSCIPAYVTLANVITYRSTGLLAVQDNVQEPAEGQVIQIARDAKKLFKSRAVDTRMVQMLQQNNAEYLLLLASSQLNTQLPHLAGFSEMDAPGERYRLYRIEREKLAATPLTEANGYLNEGRWGMAENVYATVLQTGSQDERFSALLGIGQAYTKRDLFEDAVSAYEAAAELAPQDPAPYGLMAETYASMGDTNSAKETVDRAVELRPSDTSLRVELGGLLLEAGENQEAAEQYRAVVEAYPRVPEYRVELAKALGGAAADRELEEAISLDPHSARLHQSVAEAYERMGEEGKAKEHMQRAAELKRR